MQASDQPGRPTHTDAPVILFDGICNLCEQSVQLVIRNDRQANFRFASLQSNVARHLLEQHAYDDKSLSSVVLLQDGELYQKSRAALRVARQLDRAWPLLFYLCYWIPPLIADRVYDFIGARRYRWFGKKAICWVPDASLAARFLDYGEGEATTAAAAAVEPAASKL